MSKPDIEVLDDSDAYAYSSHISVDGYEMQFGDLLLVFESNNSSTVAFFERVYGFNWPGIHTHVIKGAVPAEYHDFETLASKLNEKKMAIAPERERASYYVDEEMVRTLTLYRYVYDSGWQPILVDEHRNPLQRNSSSQSVVVCENVSEVIEELFERRPIASEQEVEHVREFLLSSGYRSGSIPTVGEASIESTS